MLKILLAGAAAAALAAAPAHAATVAVEDGDIHYVASAGESNDISIAPHKDNVDIVDLGAFINVGAGCVLRDDHVAVCTPGARPFNVRVELADGDDHVAPWTGGGNLIADGGTGADVLGGTEHPDHFTDIDTDPDTFHGRAGVDTVSFAGRSTGVELEDNLTADGDALTGIERIVGTNFADRLLTGRGDDTLLPGPGDDVLRCGRGDDVVVHPQRAERLYACETVSFDGLEVGVFPSVVLLGVIAAYDVRCADGTAGCLLRFDLFGPLGHQLGFGWGGGVFEDGQAYVQIRLLQEGAHLAARPRGVWATAVVGTSDASVGWTSNLRV